MFVLMINLVCIHCFCELNLNDNFLIKYWFSIAPIGRNWLSLVMNTFTFDFLDLKNKVLFNKTSCCIGITQMEEGLVPWEYGMEITSH
jgi:hypothetical protein